MINEIEKKRRRIRWWFNILSSILIVVTGMALVAMRYLWNLNLLQDRFWIIAGLLLGYGSFRTALYAWKRAHLYDDLENE